MRGEEGKGQIHLGHSKQRNRARHCRALNFQVPSVYFINKQVLVSVSDPDWSRYKYTPLERPEPSNCTS